MNDRGLKRVLYVEDEPDIAFVMRATLEELHGMTIEVCADAPTMLRLAPRFDPDLILLDMMLPSMDGATLLGLLRELPALARTPVVFVTAKVQSAELTRYQRLGAIGVIAKPFDPLTVGTTLLSMWQRAQGGARESSHG